jgi:sodium/bile acid cotransporter 7
MNMLMVITKSAGGDEAAAVFHCAVGNLLGAFVSPFLIFTYLGVDTHVDLPVAFTKLAI